MTLAGLRAAAADQCLALRGGLHEDGETVLLLGPDEPRFWPHFKASPEFRDGAPDPLDRWSKRVIDALAAAFGGRAVYPSDGPPYPPFLRWAAASGHAWQAPTGLMVHDEAGLFVSYRGALRLPGLLDLPPEGCNPCPTCTAQPCLTACPVGALSAGSDYDVAACRAHVASASGRDCREAGCRVRRACPVSRAFGRMPEQSAFHMAAFL